MPLSDRQILSVKSAAKPFKLFDGAGLYIDVRPGGGKLWRLKYRFGGVEKLLSLGKYPATSLKDARAGRDAAKELLATGVDPSVARKAKKAAKQAQAVNTFEVTSRAWLEHRDSAWKADTLDAIRASLENNVLPKLGQRPIAEVTPADIRGVVKAIEARGASETARRVFQRVQAIFRYAVAHELVTVDPTYSLKPAEIFKPVKVMHRASIAERDAPELLRKLDGYAGDPTTRAALSFLILTATRPGETRGARWEEVDETAGLWCIPASRMKMEAEHVVPLSHQALELLRERRPAGKSAVGLIFPSPVYPGKSLSDATFTSALARLGYKGIATAHGFRTFFSTCANEAGWNRDHIEKQLAHEERDQVRGAYNRAEWLAERAKMMQWWADRLDEMRAAGAG